MEDSSAEENRSPEKNKRLNKSVSVNLIGIILLAILLITVPVTVLLSVQNMETHESWWWESRASGDFYQDLHSAYLRLYDPYFALYNPSVSEAQNNNSVASEEVQYWFLEDIHNANSAIMDLQYLDTSHTEELNTIGYMVQLLEGAGTTYELNLNSSGRTNLADELETVGLDVSNAYLKPLDGANLISPSSLPFWWFGPQPPDQTLLKQAATLADNLTQQLILAP